MLAGGTRGHADAIVSGDGRGRGAPWAGVGRVEGFRASHLTTEQKEGVGIERFCDFGGGMSVREQVTAWEPGSHLGILFTKFSMPATDPVANFRLSEAGSGTRVDFDMAFEPKGFGRVMSALMRGAMQKNLEALLADLKAEAEKRVAAGAPVAPA